MRELFFFALGRRSLFSRPSCCALSPSSPWFRLLCFRPPIRRLHSRVVRARSVTGGKAGADGCRKMGRDAALQRCLLALAVLMVAVGVWTFSFKKVLGTYALGMLGIAGILLPDWEYFDRDYSQWFSPMPAQRTPGVDPTPGTWRFKLYPLRATMITLIYSFGLYKWWKFVSS